MLEIISWLYGLLKESGIFQHKLPIWLLSNLFYFFIFSPGYLLLSFFYFSFFSPPHELLHMIDKGMQCHISCYFWDFSCSENLVCCFSIGVILEVVVRFLFLIFKISLENAFTVQVSSNEILNESPFFCSLPHCKPLVVPQSESGNTVENQPVEDPPSSRFTWRIDNFTRLNIKKLYSEIFIVGGYKWYTSFLMLVCHINIYVRVCGHIPHQVIPTSFF